MSLLQQLFISIFSFPICELLNRIIGRDKIIWGTWDGDLPAEHFDVNFDLTDLAEDNLHPGPIAHKEYAEKIKNVLQDRFK